MIFFLLKLYMNKIIPYIILAFIIIIIFHILINIKLNFFKKMYLIFVKRGDKGIKVERSGDIGPRDVGPRGKEDLRTKCPPGPTGPGIVGTNRCNLSWSMDTLLEKEIWST